jgi:phosphoglycolate phosphatase
MAQHTYDFWLLDLDGTVVDVETSYIHEVCNDVGDQLGVSFTGQEAEQLWYGFDGARDQVLSSADIDPGRFWEVFHDVEQPQARAGATHLYADAEEFVAQVEEPIGVVTHCQEYLTGPVLDRLDIGDWFETVVCCTEETGWKPDPRPVEMAMANLGVGHNGHAGALVGDDPQDVGAAHNAGLAGIHLQRHDPDRFGQPSAGHRVGRLTDLLD